MMIFIRFFVVLIMLSVPFAAQATEGTTPIQKENPKNAMAPPGVNPDEVKAPTQKLDVPYYFGKENKVRDGAKHKDLVPLHRPHRTERELAVWISNKAAEIMTVEYKQAANHPKKIRPLFSKSGFTQYGNYLKSTNLIPVLQQNRLTMSSIVTGTPFLINEGLMDGSYHWLFEVPVLLSYIDSSITDNAGTGYNSARKLPAGEKIKIRIQIGRSNQADNADGIWIEWWEMRKNGD